MYVCLSVPAEDDYQLHFYARWNAATLTQMLLDIPITSALYFLNVERISKNVVTRIETIYCI